MNDIAKAVVSELRNHIKHTLIRMHTRPFMWATSKEGFLATIYCQLDLYDFYDEERSAYNAFIKSCDKCYTALNDQIDSDWVDDVLETALKCMPDLGILW